MALAMRSVLYSPPPDRQGHPMTAMRSYDMRTSRAIATAMLATALLATALLFAPIIARAQSPAAAALIDQGIARREAGDDQGALALFQRAYAASPSARAAAQLALCEQALGNWVQAHAHLKEALEASSDAWIRRNRASLDAAFAAIGEQVGTLEVLGAVPGAVVRLGGRAVGTLPMSGAATVIVGRASLEVVADGYLPFTVEVNVRPGELTRQSVTLEARAAERATPTVTPTPEQTARAASADGVRQDDAPDSSGTREDESSSIASQWWFWTIIGVVVVGGVVATVLIAGSGGVEDPIAGSTGVATALTF